MIRDLKLSTAELLYKRAQQMGLKPSWVKPDGLFAISVAGQERYINCACSPLNSHISAQLAKNKYLARLVLGRHDMPNIPFARPYTQVEAEAFLRQHKKIIAKPVNGSGSCDIHIVTDAAQLQVLNIGEYILEKYIAGQELRYLILNQTVVAVHQSDYGTSVEETRPLKRISYPSDVWDQSMVSMSRQIACAFDLNFAAIDYIVDTSGYVYVLEVNASPGLKWFHAPSSGPAVDVARLFMEATFDSQHESFAIDTPLEALSAVAYS